MSGEGRGLALGDLDVAVGQRPEQPRADQGGRAQGVQQCLAGAQVEQDIDAGGGVVVVARVELRMDLVPVADDQPADECESLGQPVDSRETQSVRGSAVRRRVGLWIVPISPVASFRTWRQSGSSAATTVSPMLRSGVPSAAWNAARKSASYSKSGPAGSSGLTGSRRSSMSFLAIPSP